MTSEQTPECQARNSLDPKPKSAKNLVFTEAVSPFVILQGNAVCGCGGRGRQTCRRGTQSITGNLLSEVKGPELDFVSDGSQ